MERCREERGLFPEHHFRPSLYRADSASRARGRGRLLGAPSGAGCTAAAGSAEHPSVEQLFDLYGFVAILLRTSNLIARSVAGGSAAFLVFIAAPLAREAKNAEGARLLALARRWVLAAAAATLAAALAGVALQAVALAGTLWAPIGVVLGAGFVLVAAGVALAALAIVALAAPCAPPGPLP